jgi:hypothetical protein
MVDVDIDVDNAVLERLCVVLCSVSYFPILYNEINAQ